MRAELKLFISETESFTNHVKESFRGDRRVNIPSLGKLASSLGSLKTRFLYLWGIYSAHSKAEDEIVFPALEAKHMQSGVCQGYSIDHEHEERLFSQLSDVMQKVEQNVEQNMKKGVEIMKTRKRQVLRRYRISWLESMRLSLKPFSWGFSWKIVKFPVL